MNNFVMSTKNTFLQCCTHGIILILVCGLCNGGKSGRVGKSSEKGLCVLSPLLRTELRYLKGKKQDEYLEFPGIKGLQARYRQQ